MIVDAISALFIFVLIVSGNFLSQLFPCKVQTMLANSMLLKHCFGVLTLYFFAILQNKEFSGATGMWIAAVLYCVFLVNAKCSTEAWIVTFVLAAAVYMMEETFEKETVETAQYACVVSMAAVTLWGVAVYMREQKQEYGDEFRYDTFFLGVPICKKNG